MFLNWMKKALCLIIATLLVMIIYIGLSKTVSNTVFADAGTSKTINVVFDDSGSMYENGETRWCKAKYALEVFASMMGPNDRMNVFCMNGSEVHIDASNYSDRVNVIHNMNSEYGDTPFSSIARAGDPLIEMGGETGERWLVVLTDGEMYYEDYEIVTQEDLQDELVYYADNGINTVYLCIGYDAVVLDSQPERNFYTEHAVESVDILSSVTRVANQIFDHQVVSKSFIDITQNEYTIDIDIPIDQLIVFAQGESVSLGDMEYNGELVRPVSNFEVRHSGDVMPTPAVGGSPSDFLVDYSLHGYVTTFEPTNAMFDAGTYKINITNATMVEFYYRPKVEIGCDLIYNGNPVQATDQLYSGDYEVSMYFVNPLTGQHLDSKLLVADSYSLTVNNNDSTQEIPFQSGTFSLNEGSVETIARAYLPGNISLQTTNTYKVLPKPISLLLSVENTCTTYNPDQLGSLANPYSITVYHADTGEKLSEEEWNSTELSLESGGGIVWDIEKGSEVGTWVARPISADGTISGVIPGDYTFVAAAQYQIGDQFAYGTGIANTSIIEYAGSSLYVDIQDPQSDIFISKLSSEQSLQVHVSYLNPNTGMVEPITEAMWNMFDTNVSTTGDLKWSVEMGDTPGSYILTPSASEYQKLISNGGVETITFSIGGQEGERSYFGIDNQDVNVNPLSPGEKALKVLPFLLGLLLLLFIILGYVRKYKIPAKTVLRPRKSYVGMCYSTKNKAKDRAVIKKDTWSVLWPWARAEKAVIRCYKPSHQCDFGPLSIEAVSNYSFKITNSDFPITRTKIDGKAKGYYKKMEDLRKETFSYPSFSIVSVDTQTNRAKGTFKFE